MAPEVADWDRVVDRAERLAMTLSQQAVDHNLVARVARACRDEGAACIRRYVEAYRASPFGRRSGATRNHLDAMAASLGQLQGLPPYECSLVLEWAARLMQYTQLSRVMVRG